MRLNPFAPKHQILELPAIPRERPALQSLINEARAAARRSRMINWAAGLIVCAALCVLMGAFSSGAPEAPEIHLHRTLLPVVGRPDAAQGREMGYVTIGLNGYSDSQSYMM